MIDTCVIFAGGKGTRLGSLTQILPKPMVTVGDKPIIWHIMKHYSHYGVDKFIVLAGYKQECIKEYFQNYFFKNSDSTIDLENQNITIHNTKAENWKITILDTGYDNLTSSRLLQAKNYIKDSQFFLTYADGLADIDIKKLYDFHVNCKKTCTMTIVQPTPRFGVVVLDKDNVTVKNFEEKIKADDNWINGGFFVCNRQIFEYLDEDITISFENGPLKRLVADKQLAAYKLHEKWQCMDTERERQYLSELYTAKKAFWRT